MIDVPTTSFQDCRLVREPNTSFEDLLHPFVRKLFFEFEGNYITSAMRKSMLDVPVPGSC